MIYFKFFIIFIFLAPAFQAQAKKSIQRNNYYKSDADKLVTIKTISVLPFIDNTKGIYSKPFEAFVKNSIEDNPKWTLEDIHIVGNSPSISNLENNPEQIKKYARHKNVDAIIAGKAIRSENGLNIYLGLFLAKDGLLLAKENILSITQSDLKGLSSPFKNILNKLIKHIPYDGMILSRNDKLVTLNLSKADGIVDGQSLTVATILQLERHPKFNFIISNEKIILGKLRVKKVDDSITFAEIIAEKEKGSIQKDAKIVGANFVNYSGGGMLSNYDPNNSGSSVASGNTTRASRWRPAMPPSFGKVEATFGLGVLKASNGDAFSENNFYPSVTIDGEVWIDSDWSVHAMTKQGIGSLADPDGAADLSIYTAAYELLGGYNFRMNGTYGTKFEVLAGLAMYKSTVDNASPSKFTSAKYTGVKIGADVQTPLFETNEYLVGASIYFFLNPHLSERPSPSGRSGDSTVTMFKAYGMKKMQENIYWQASINHDLYSTSFGRVYTASSSSQKHTTFNVGVNYFF